MRRLAFLAAVAAVACSSSKKDDSGDRTPPAVPTIDAPASGATLGPASLVGGEVVFSGTAEPAATVQLELDGALLGSATATNAGGWSWYAALADGTHAVRARATDAAGNASAYSGAVSFSLDTTAPRSPVILFPAGGAALAGADLAAGLLVFSGTAEPGATVAVEIDGAAAGSSVATGSGSWAVAAPVADGDHAVRARASDALGNASALCAAVSFSLDATSPPEPAVLAPVQDALLGAAALVAGSVIVSGTAEAGATVEVVIDGTTAGSAVATGAGTWSVAVTLADGRHDVQARAADAVGNASLLSGPISFALDAVPPEPPTIRSPQDGATLFPADLVAGRAPIDGSAEPGATVALDVDGDAAGTAVADANGAWSIAALVDSGAHSATAYAVDAAGNVSRTSAGVGFTVDATRLAYPVGAIGVTSFGQTVAAVPPLEQVVFPYQANAWIVDRDFSLLGSGYQYAFALALYVGTPSSPRSFSSLLGDVDPGGALVPFPWDQDASEAVFLTPTFGETDGVVTAVAADGSGMGPAAAPFAGGHSAYLNGTSDSRLWRTLVLAPGDELSWTHQVSLRAGSLGGADAAPFAPSYLVALRDPTTGAQIEPLYPSRTSVLPEVVTIAPGVTGSVVLSFELRSAAGGFAEIDAVKLNGSVVSNGGFEADLSEWSWNAGAESQNVRSGPRDVGVGGSSLRVTRTFYAPPASPWGRLVDLFENPGTAPVATSAVYLTALGGGASSLQAVTQGGAALVGWDPNASVRDLAIVSGDGIPFLDDPSAPTGLAFVVHDLTVPAGGSVALVHFVVQLGEAAGGPSAADVPTNTDDECARIAAGFPAQDAYRIDLEPGILGRVANF